MEKSACEIIPLHIFRIVSMTKIISVLLDCWTKTSYCWQMMHDTEWGKTVEKNGKKSPPYPNMLTFPCQPLQNKLFLMWLPQITPPQILNFLMENLNICHDRASLTLQLEDQLCLSPSCHSIFSNCKVHLSWKVQEDQANGSSPCWAVVWAL